MSRPGLLNAALLVFGVASAHGEPPAPAVSVLTHVDAPFFSSGAFTVGKPTVVQIRLGVSPADYAGPLELVMTGGASKALVTVERLTIPPPVEPAPGPSRVVSLEHTLVFNREGEYRCTFRAGEGGVASDGTIVDVFPAGVPTTLSRGSGNTVRWRGRDIVADRLLVQLKKKKDHAGAARLARSVGMTVSGYLQLVAYWEFAFPGKGSAAQIEKAYRALSASDAVLHVDVDNVMKGF